MKRWLHRRKRWLPGLIACICACAGLLAYIFGLAWLQLRWNPIYSASDLFVARTIDATIAIWSFWVGSSIGSFLNVVAWRLPKGQSINGRSHCPRCQATLGLLDNLPVIGWLLLAGRCRTCRLPISLRYPVVEFVVGLSTALFAVGQAYLLSVPGLTMHVSYHALWAPRLSVDSIAVLVFHLYATAALWAFALVRFDDHRLPSKLVGWGLVPIIVAMLAMPWLGIVSWQVTTPTTGDLGYASMREGTLSTYVSGVLRVVTAMVAAAILGRSLARGLCPTADPKLDPLGKSTAELMDIIVILSVPSLLLGWQSVIAVVVISSIVAAIIQKFFFTNRKILGCFAVTLCVALSLHLAFWNTLSQLSTWPTPQSQPLTILAWAGLILLTPLWLRKRHPNQIAPAHRA